MLTDLGVLLKEYIYSEYSDYAYLLTGGWGSGKTYYITNTFKEVAVQAGYRLIYLSLSGVVDIERMKEIVYFQLNLRNKHNKSISFERINNMLAFIKLFPRVSNWASIMLGANRIYKDSASQIPLSKTVLIVDDLERLSKEIERVDVINQIYEHFTKYGCKTIFLSNDYKITDEMYSFGREKVIRRIISFQPEFIELANEVVRKRYYSATRYDIINQNLWAVVSILKDNNINNIRTLCFIIDYIIPILNLHENPIVSSNIEFLIKNISVLAIEFKLGNISTEKMSNKEELKQITIRPYGFGSTKNKEEEKYSESFYGKYCISQGIKYIYFESLYNYITSGILNKEQLIVELDKTFSSNRPICEVEIDKLVEFYMAEEDDVLRYYTNTLKYIEDGCYSLVRFPYIYTLLKRVEDYIDLCVQGGKLEDSIRIGLDRSSDYTDEKIEWNDGFIDFYHTYDATKATGAFYQEMVARIKTTIEQKIQKNESDNIALFFRSIIGHNDEYRKYYSKIGYGKIFKQIVFTDSLQYLDELDNYGIRILESIIYTDILNVVNAGEHGSQQIEPLKQMKDYILGLIARMDVCMRRKRLSELSEAIENAIHHLEKTKR